MQRMYARIDFKAMGDDDERVIEGVASTPSTDRYEDVVEPEGAQYKLPIPLLWQHDSRSPIGLVENARVTKDGITIRAKLAAPGVSEQIDKAWSLIKAGLVRGLSIGFRALETADIKGTFGIRFLQWEWLELSAVTVPANADASITSIKRFDDEQLRAASGDTASGSARERSTFKPGVTGKRAAPNPKGDAKVKPIIEQIKDFSEQRQAKQARMDELIDKAAEAGATMDETEQQEYDQLEAECKDIDGHIKRLERRQEQIAASAKPVDKAAGTDADAASRARVPANQIRVRSNLEPGQRFARAALAIARCRGNLHEAVAYAMAHKGWQDTSPDVAKFLQMKTAIPAADTSTSGWASEWAYTDNLVSDFIEYLRPRTIIGRVQGFRRVPFNVRVGGMSAGTSGSWVGESGPIPVSKGTSTSVSLGITKAAGISAITKELLQTSAPSAEILVRNDLAAAVQYVLDRTLIDPNLGIIANERPAAVTYGLTPVTPTGTNYAALAADFKSLVASMITDNIDMSGAVWVMSRSTALALSLMVTSLGVSQFPGMTPEGGMLFGYPVIVSQSAYFGSGSPDYGNLIVFMVPSEIYLADDGMVDVEMSDQVSLQLLDNPTNDSGGSTTATAMVSMFQTESVAIKAVRYINWKVRRSNAAAFIRNANYS
jgi:HK97 family phage major capsid protein/HK97 family phage prohead protease